MEQQFIDSQYGRKFTSISLNKEKFKEAIGVAEVLRDFRNSLSEYVWADVFKYMNMSQNEFLKYIRANFKIKLHSNFDYDQITQVYTDYQNRFKSIIRQITFTYRRFKEIELYATNTKWHRKGEFKGCKFKKEKTLLTNCLTYLSRYGREDTVEYIKNQLKNNKKLNDSKREYYENILKVIDKIGFERLYSFALRKRNKVLEEYLKRDRIEYTSLTFGARSRKKEFLVYNDNYNSEIKNFVLLSWENEKNKLVIPVKYSKSFHGSLDLINKNEKNFQYEMSFNEKLRRVYIHFSVAGQREVFDATECTEYIAADVNVKHNMFCLSDEIMFNHIMTRTIDYDRELIEEYSKLQKKIKQNKENNPEYKEGKRIRIKRGELKKKMKQNIQQTIAFMMEAIKKAGFNHLILENMTGINSKCYSKDENGVNNAEIIKFVGLSSLKDECIHIGHKHGVGVSLVQAAYTSQTCPVCGHIHRNNRKNQESFICEHCGYAENADINSS